MTTRNDGGDAGKPLAYSSAIRARQNAGLEKGRRVREANAVVKRLLKEGKLDPKRMVAGTLDKSDPVQAAAARAVARWVLPTVLISIPGIGPAKQQEILATMQVSPRMKLGELRQQRREEMARYVGLALARRA